MITNEIRLFFVFIINPFHILTLVSFARKNQSVLMKNFLDLYCVTLSVSYPYASMEYVNDAVRVLH